MVITTGIASSVGSLSFKRSPSINIKKVRAPIFYHDNSPELGCFCFPITKVENSEDISGKSY